MIDLDSTAISMGDTDKVAPTDMGLAVAEKPAMLYAGHEATIDRHTKKVFVVDKSYSMSGTLTAVAAIACLVWPPDVYDWMEQRIKNAEARRAAADSEPDFDDGDGDDDDDDGSTFNDIPADIAVPYPELASDDPAFDHEWAVLADCVGDNDRLRAAALKEELAVPFEVDKPFTVSKRELVKTLIARVVRDRVQRYPDADIAGLFFDTTVEHMMVRWDDPETGKRRERKPTAEELIEIVRGESFNGGGTDITKGVRSAMSLCKRAPSKVKRNHIILVTDGEDSGVTEIAQFVDEMIDMNIALDVVHIATVDPEDSAAVFLRGVCARTGGAYALADNVNALQDNFLEASNRLLLTAGGAQ